jgi:hypothetical protein
MDNETIKVECLKLVAETLPHPDAPRMVEAAETLYRWVTSSGDPFPTLRADTADRS